jgi:ribosomal protein S18 acetylase RimI-like enzyme
VIRIAAAMDVTPELLGALDRLLPQLSRSAKPVVADELAQILASQATTLLIARDDDDANAGEVVGDQDDLVGGSGPIVGMLTLATFRIPTGVRAWIEDVVVDEAARGKGVGEALTQAALELAVARGARTVELTSRPSREAANRLYQRVGFTTRETNVYRFDLGPDQTA